MDYTPLVYGPPSLSHLYEDKYARVENLLLIGRSDHFDESVDTMDESTDRSLLIRHVSPLVGVVESKNKLTCSKENHLVFQKINYIM